MKKNSAQQATTDDLPLTPRNTLHESLLNVWWTGVLMRRSSRRFFKTLKTTEAEFNILVVLRDTDEPMTQVALGRRLLVDKANITGLVDRLEKADFLRRKPVTGDRRRYHLALTPKGLREADRLDKAFREKVGKIMSECSSPEQTRLIALMKKVRTGLAGSE